MRKSVAVQIYRIVQMLLMKMEVPCTGRAIPGHVNEPHIPERIGLCGPLSGCELYHHVALHHNMGYYLVVKSVTRPNKASKMACHNGQIVAVRSTTNICPNSFKIHYDPNHHR